MQEEANQKVSVTTVDTKESVKRSFKKCQGVLRELLTPLSHDRVISPLLLAQISTRQSIPVVADVSDTSLLPDMAIIPARPTREFHEDINEIE